MYRARAHKLGVHGIGGRGDPTERTRHNTRARDGSRETSQPSCIDTADVYTSRAAALAPEGDSRHNIDKYCMNGPMRAAPPPRASSLLQCLRPLLSHVTYSCRLLGEPEEEGVVLGLLARELSRARRPKLERRCGAVVPPDVHGGADVGRVGDVEGLSHPVQRLVEAFHGPHVIEAPQEL